MTDYVRFGHRLTEESNAVTFGVRGHPVPCLGCGILVKGASYCSACAQRLGRRAPGGRRPGYNSSERRRRSKVIEDWRLVYGDWCPGFQRQGHPSKDLTADHIISVRSGGDEGGVLTVLCRSCNSAKGAS